MPGAVFDTLMDVAADQYGYVTTENAREVGVDPVVLRLMAHRGTAERIAHGLYRLRLVPATVKDQLMEATLWPRNLGVISHDSALGDLWELCDVNPSKIHVTVPPSARIRRRAPATYQVHERELAADAITDVDGIRVVTARRAILDGIERHLGGHLIDQAIENALAGGLIDGAAVDEIRSARVDR